MTPQVNEALLLVSAFWQGEMDTYRRQLRETIGKPASVITKALGEIAKLDLHRAANIAGIESRLLTVERNLKTLEDAPVLVSELGQWLSEMRAALAAEKQSAARRMGPELEKALALLGLELRGHVPLLTAGVFSIEVVQDRSIIVLWFGPRQERLGEYPLAAAVVANAIGKLSTGLGSGLSHQDFVTRLGRALSYCRLDADTDGMVPIVSLLRQMALAIQNNDFSRNPVRQNYRDYGRVDFACDLMRNKSAVRLRTATREYARSRDTALWIPSEDQRGDGSLYSHIALK